MASSTSTENTNSKTIQSSEVEVPRNGSTTTTKRNPSTPLTWRLNPRRPQVVRRSTTELDDYFNGPYDVKKHSKWPFFLRMHGSVLPKMLLPLIVVGLWSTAITLISEFKFQLKVSSLLLTILGFVVGMAISFRTSSAYERYTEGRKYWSQMGLASQNLARTIWIHSKEREGDVGKEDLLMKISALNLIVSFAYAVKHKLRFEPGIDYADLKDGVEYLDTFAKEAESTIPKTLESGTMKRFGEFLGVSFAESNPRKRVKRSAKPLGNLPLEILSHLSSYVQSVIDNKTMEVGLYQNQAIGSVVTLNEVFVGVERVLATPLPIAYSIAISQITWVYVMMLPFQLWDDLRWITIPGCIFAAYIILGIAAIGREIENPFGTDVNDLPMDDFCFEIEQDIDIIMSQPAPNPKDFMRKRLNMPLYQLSPSGFNDWMSRPKHEIREALMAKTKADMRIRKSMNPARLSAEEKHAAAMQQEV